LWDSGVEVSVFITGSEEDLKGDAKINYEIIKKLNIPLSFINTKKDLNKISNDKADIIVDALLGTGITGAVYGFMKEVISLINEFDGLIVSVDVPSGLNSDSPEVDGLAVLADITVSMALPKHCHVFYPARSYVGELYVTDIGIPKTVTHSSEIKTQLVENVDIHVPLPSSDSHKYHQGKVGVLAGSAGFTGAAILTSKAAMRIGAGLVHLAIPQHLNSIFETHLTEVITRPYPDEQFNNLDDQIRELLDWCDVLAIGPGLGREKATQRAVIDVLQNISKPVVIDADALFALSQFPDTLKKARPNWILTPHHGEFQRLLDKGDKKEFSSRYVSLAREFATRHQLTLLLKGTPSLTASAEGQIYVNATGNAGLASGGTGDVLTGFVAGLVAQGLMPENAAVTANFLHGKCADEIIEKTSPNSLMAGDLLQNIGTVIKEYQ
jgi:NAD(P)H-hydrate epimerase